MVYGKPDGQVCHHSATGATGGTSCDIHHPGWEDVSCSGDTHGYPHGYPEILIFVEPLFLSIETHGDLGILAILRKSPICTD